MSDEIKVESGAESATAPKELSIDERVALFNVGLKELLGKYRLALAAEARIHEGKVLADPKVIDADTLTQNKPVVK